MSDSIIPRSSSGVFARRGAPLSGLARRTMLTLMAGLREGRLILAEGDRRLAFGDAADDGDLTATVTVTDPRFYSKLLLGGSIGAGEAYMSGWWQADDLTRVVRILVRNESVLAGMDQGWRRITGAAHRVVHWLNKNTQRGSRGNIRAHYDLGNDFYALFLDPTMTYSCGIFESPDADMETASIAKYDRICRKIGLSARDHVLEIGTGWGGFALYAAGRYGCNVTTTTISEAQHALAARRVRDAGLDHRVTLLRKDYRDLEGRFDKLVSIEMIEAVGHQYYDAFFHACCRLLEPDGLMALQAIIIRDDRYAAQLDAPDFIKRYIFPGSCIPSIAAIGDAVARRTDLRLFHLEDITPHYPVTLRRWRTRFFDNIEKVRAMGFPEAFIRMWEFYLCYCEGSFLERYIGDVQMIFARPRCRMASILPAL